MGECLCHRHSRRLFLYRQGLFGPAGALVSRFTSRTKTRLDDYLVAAVKGPLTAIIFVQGALIALSAMTLTNAY